MAEYITLLGTEDVQKAGSSMRSAAEGMQSAASSLEDSLSRHRQFMDDWLMRLEEAITHIPDPG
jgi:hypothetical protein